MSTAIEQYKTGIDRIHRLEDALSAVATLQRVQNEAAALKLQAERRAGQLLDDDEEGASELPAVERNRYRKLAGIDRSLFDDYLANAYSRGDEITRTAVLKLAPVAQRTPVASVDYVAPSVTDELAMRIHENAGEAVAELLSSSITKALTELVDAGHSRRAMIWCRYKGIDDNGEQARQWTFAGIAKMIPNRNGSPSTREYIENQYRIADQQITSSVLSSVLEALQTIIRDLI